MVNSMMMGRLGQEQLAAIGLCNQGLDFFNILCQGGLGVVILTAQYWGSKDIKSWKQAFTLMLRIILSIALVLTILMLAIPETLARMFSPDPAVIAEATGYIRLYAFALIPMAIGVTMTMVLRTIRQVNIPLFASILAFFINIGVNYAFIFGNFGAPALGIKGAALGIICARLQALHDAVQELSQLRSAGSSFRPVYGFCLHDNRHVDRSHQYAVCCGHSCCCSDYEYRKHADLRSEPRGNYNHRK